MDYSSPIEQRFVTDKSARIHSDYCSSGVWDKHGVNVPTYWLPVSWYAKGLIQAMQAIYDSQEIAWEGEEIPYSTEHYETYEVLRSMAHAQVKLELADWEVL